jgi:hypothetical protein
MPQNEIVSGASVLDDTGRPQNFGWSRQPGFFYDPALVWAPRRRLSEADRYIVLNPTYTVIFEIRDDGYVGRMAITVVSIKDKRRSTQIFQTLLPFGSYEMPTGSQSGAIHYRKNKNLLDFVPMEGGARIIKVDIPRFGHGRSLRGELVLNEPAFAESLVCNLPWRHDKNAFRYSRFSPWYTTEGVIQFGSTEIIFTRGNAWGILDWNRAVRPRVDIQYRAMACGQNGGHTLSLCVGHGLVNSSVCTENAFFMDGRLHKLEQVTFHIPAADWLSPWRFTSNDNRLEMIFHPQQERSDHRQILFHSFKRRQMFGSFTGKATLDDGSEVKFHNITGFAERVKMRY